MYGWYLCSYVADLRQISLCCAATHTERPRSRLGIEHMASALLDAARRPFVDVAQECLSGSLVYLDQGAGEVAHSSLGLPFLLGECMGPDARPMHGLHGQRCGSGICPCTQLRPEGAICVLGRIRIWDQILPMP